MKTLRALLILTMAGGVACGGSPQNVATKGVPAAEPTTTTTVVDPGLIIDHTLPLPVPAAAPTTTTTLRPAAPPRVPVTTTTTTAPKPAVVSDSTVIDCPSPWSPGSFDRMTKGACDQRTWENALDDCTTPDLGAVGYQTADGVNHPGQDKRGDCNQKWMASPNKIAVYTFPSEDMHLPACQDWKISIPWSASGQAGYGKRYDGVPPEAVASRGTDNSGRPGTHWKWAYKDTQMNGTLDASYDAFVVDGFTLIPNTYTAQRNCN